MVFPQERKAARASKEAMKQLHSESQRMIRGQFTRIAYTYLFISSCLALHFWVIEMKCEKVFDGSHVTEIACLTCSSVCVESTLGLPYHLPEPKTIDQFFKKRARPEGPAMALLK